MSAGIGLAAAGGAGLLGSLFQSSAAKSAASTQANASTLSALLNFNTAQQSQQLIQGIYNRNVGIMAPFTQAGYGGIAAEQGFAGLGPNVGGTPLLSQLTQPFAPLQPFQPTMAQLEGTPGYQFALKQGLLGVDFQNSAMGLGGVTGKGITGGTGGVGATAGPPPGAVPSGPLGKALANYAVGAASTTYQNQFQNYLQQQQQQFSQYLGQNQQVYNMLAGAYGGIASQGLGSAGATVGAGTTSAGQQANALLTGASNYGAYSTGAAAAQAAGQVGSASALSSGLGTLGQLALFNAISQTPSSGTTGATTGIPFF